MVCRIQSQLRAVITDEVDFQKVVLRSQQVLHFLFPSSELVVGKEQILSVQANLGVSVDAFKDEFDVLFFEQFFICIKVQRVIPRRLCLQILD